MVKMGLRGRARAKPLKTNKVDMAWVGLFLLLQAKVDHVGHDGK